MQGLKCKVTDEIGKTYRFHYFSIETELKLQMPMPCFYFPLPALCSLSLDDCDGGVAVVQIRGGCKVEWIDRVVMNGNGDSEKLESALA